MRQKRAGFGYWKWQINKRNFDTGPTWIDTIHVAMSYEGANNIKAHSAHEAE